MGPPTRVPGAAANPPAGYLDAASTEPLHPAARAALLAVIDDVLISDRPPLTIAAGEGPWTAKAVAHVARDRTEESRAVCLLDREDGVVIIEDERLVGSCGDTDLGARATGEVVLLRRRPKTDVK